MFKKTVVVGMVLLGAASLTWAQGDVQVPDGSACSYEGKPVRGRLPTFKSEAEARATIALLLRQVGLPRNFIIFQSPKVPNACAFVYKQERYILYNKKFMNLVARRTDDYWASVSIMAHELYHHLCGHTIRKGGSQPALELEADYGSGFVLYKLGATLAQAQIAMKKLAPDTDGDTHPGRAKRLRAIARGYRAARELVAEQKKPVSQQKPTPRLTPSLRKLIAGIDSEFDGFKGSLQMDNDYEKKWSASFKLSGAGKTTVELFNDEGDRKAFYRTVLFQGRDGRLAVKTFERLDLAMRRAMPSDWKRLAVDVKDEMVRVVYVKGAGHGSRVLVEIRVFKKQFRVSAVFTNTSDV